MWPPVLSLTLPLVGLVGSGPAGGVFIRAQECYRGMDGTLGLGSCWLWQRPVEELGWGGGACWWPAGCTQNLSACVVDGSLGS